MSHLVFLPALDSIPLAAARKRELDIDRSRATFLGQSAVQAARDGAYLDEHGRRVEWRGLVEAACASAVSLPPDTNLTVTAPPAFTETRVQVTNETTLGAARRLVERGDRTLALNFANGAHPGGGGLHGSRAQEDVLCRSSALYLTLEHDAMYPTHRARPAPDSTDWAILSPNVPVFRTDAGATLPAPWMLNVLTCAAPVAPSVGQPKSGDLLARRILRVLAIAQAYNYTSLVLGAWGCGAFGNDPARTARDFRAALEGPFAGAFAEVVFAIADWSAERRYLGPFGEVFA